MVLCRKSRTGLSEVNSRAFGGRELPASRCGWNYDLRCTTEGWCGVNINVEESPIILQDYPMGLDQVQRELGN